MATSVRQRRSGTPDRPFDLHLLLLLTLSFDLLYSQQHDSRGSSIGTIHLAFTLPSTLLFLFFSLTTIHPLLSSLCLAL